MRLSGNTLYFLINEIFFGIIHFRLHITLCTLYIPIIYVEFNEYIVSDMIIYLAYSVL